MTAQLKSRATASIGGTSYEIEDSTTPNVLKIKRTDSRGIKTEFFVPRELVMGYAVQRLEDVVMPMIRKVLRG